MVWRNKKSKSAKGRTAEDFIRMGKGVERQAFDLPPSKRDLWNPSDASERSSKKSRNASRILNFGISLGAQKPDTKKIRQSKPHREISKTNSPGSAAANKKGGDFVVMGESESEMDEPKRKKIPSSRVGGSKLTIRQREKVRAWAEKREIKKKKVKPSKPKVAGGKCSIPELNIRDVVEFGEVVDRPPTLPQSFLKKIKKSSAHQRPQISGLL